MQFATNQTLYTFDDVLLVPQKSDIRSRSEVNLKTGGLLGLDLPFISANMDTVTDASMALAMAEYGGLGIVHRFMSVEELKKQIAKFYSERGVPFDRNGNLPPRQVGHSAYESLALSVGINSPKEFIDVCIQYARIICVDVAHGHNSHAASVCEYIVQKNPLATIIAGNVATPEGVRFLAKSGADIIKVGIGPGSLCTTRLVTGHGIPQLSAIMGCAAEAESNNVEIIADGGIRTSGDIAKALAAGAHYVMLGSLFAGCEETPGRIISQRTGPNTYERFKQYRGMASLEAQVDGLGRDSDEVVPEGAAKLVPLKGSAKKIIFNLAGGLCSALSYSGARNLHDFRKKATFVKVTPTVLTENRAHGLNG